MTPSTANVTHLLILLLLLVPSSSQIHQDDDDLASNNNNNNNNNILAPSSSQFTQGYYDTLTSTINNNNTCRIEELQTCPSDDAPTQPPIHHTTTQESQQEEETTPICIGNYNIPTTTSSSSETNLFERGISAQAYKPNAPIKTTICSSHHHETRWFFFRRPMTHRIAKSTFTKSSTKKPSPSIKIRGTIIGCDTQNDCCSPLSPNDDATVEVWQARPDGSYSSLIPEIDEGDCRATVLLQTDGSFELNTVMPGSTGGLGGIGPPNLLFSTQSRFDLPFYGPPIIHFLVTSSHRYAPVLDAIEFSSWGGFQGYDFRGSSLVATKSVDEDSSVGIELVSYRDDDGRSSTIEIDMNIILRELDPKETVAPKEELLCPSKWYGLPYSFFMEPISVCAPKLLEFFPV